MPSGRPTDRPTDGTHAHPGSSGPLGAAYRSAHSSTARAGCEAGSGVQVGDSIMTAGNSRTAHSRAILAEHRPMPCYGVVNASMITDKATPVVQAQGIRTRPGSKCIPSARIRYGGQLMCPTRAQTSPCLLIGQALRESSWHAHSGRIPSRFSTLRLRIRSPTKRYHAAGPLVN